MKFVKIGYFIHQSKCPPRFVKGYAFEIPGWPEFHACVRFARREEWSSKAWILDHYDTGLALRQAGDVAKMEDAPEAVRLLLETKGRERVSAVLAEIIPLAVSA